jgi:ribosomal protein S18 acetylase RimI-like enzyme
LLGSNTPQIFFKAATEQESLQIQEQMALFYGQELFVSGVYEDKNEALKAAADECAIRDPAGSCTYYRLVSNDIPYGYLIYSAQDGTAYLEGIYLDKEYRGRGLSKLILQNFELELKEKGIHTVWLYVFAHNQPALKLYEKMGYVVENAFSKNNKPLGYQMKKNLRATAISCAGSRAQPG